jgi:hypothetical protein
MGDGLHPTINGRFLCEASEPGSEVRTDVVEQGIERVVGI